MAVVSPAHAEKRRLLQDAAVRVFARKGYHASRVGDIAKEAGVAYGLLYHYFASKEEVLESIFRDTWSEMLSAVRGIEAAGGTVGDQLRKVSKVVLGSWKLNPDLVRVLVREVARSPQLQREVREIAEAMDVLEQIVRAAQERGEVRRELEPRIAAWAIYGALEEVLTGWVMGRPPAGDGEVEAAASTVAEILAHGLVSD